MTTPSRSASPETRGFETTSLMGMTVFVRTVEAGSFSAAAAQLGLSPQMAGRHIRQIEERFGTRLLNRSTRNQSLTEVGRLYYDQCKRALAQVEAAESVLAAHSDTPRGKLRIASPVSFASNHLAPLLSQFLFEFPDIRIDLNVTDVPVDVVEEGFDVAFWVGPMPNSTLNMRTLAPYRMMLVASPAYLKGRDTPTCPDDLRQHECLDHSISPFGAATVWRFRHSGVSYEVPIDGRLRISDERALVDAAIANSGVLLGCRSQLRTHVKEGRLVHLLQDYEIDPLPINMVFFAQPDMPKKVRRFIDWMVDEGGERSRLNRLADVTRP